MGNPSRALAAAALLVAVLLPLPAGADPCADNYFDGSPCVPPEEVAVDLGASVTDLQTALDDGDLTGGGVFAHCNTFWAPADEVTDTDSVTSVFRAPRDLTIVEVWCETDVGTVTMDVQIDDGGTPADVMETDLECDVTGENDDAPNNPGMSDGDRLDWKIDSVATSPLRLSVCIEYTFD